MSGNRFRYALLRKTHPEAAARLILPVEFRYFNAVLNSLDHPECDGIESSHDPKAKSTM
jgi:tetrahydromethanopterin S-methyltransferase subunit D